MVFALQENMLRVDASTVTLEIRSIVATHYTLVGAVVDAHRELAALRTTSKCH